jgi:tagatose-1,6-bisphosphate aldolase
VESIANNYGVAKLELYYHPAEENAAYKKQMVAELYDYCKYEGIDFVLELLVYHQATEEPSEEVLTETQLIAVQEFRDSCDLLAVEYLSNSLAAVTITAELDIPWIMTGREVEYETIKNDLRASLESGASGFLLGDIFWPKVDATTRDAQDFQVSHLLSQIENQSRDRIIELSRIVEEHAKKSNE